MADNQRRSSMSTDTQADKLADHFRRVADQVIDASQQVISSFSSTDPQKRMDLLREWGNQLIVNAFPIISWFEKTLHPDAAHIEKLRLTNIADEAVACAGSSQPQFAGGKVNNSAPGEQLTSAQRRMSAFIVAKELEAASLRDWASKLEAEQSGNNGNDDLTKWPTVDMELLQIRYKGKAHNIDDSQALCFDAMIKAKGDWVSLSGIGITKPSAVMQALPSELQCLFQSAPGKGYRLVIPS